MRFARRAAHAIVASVSLATALRSTSEPQRPRALKTASREILRKSRASQGRSAAYRFGASRENACIYEKSRQDRQSLQTDPVGYDDDLNLYAYVRNDPLNLSDSTGRQSEILQMEREEEQRFRESLTPEQQQQWDAASYEANKQALGGVALAATVISPIPGDEALAATAVGGTALRSEVGRELFSTASEIAITAAMNAAGPQPSTPQPTDGVSVEGIEAQARDPLAGTQATTGDTRVEDRQTAAANQAAANRTDQGRASPRAQPRTRAGRTSEIIRAILRIITPPH